MAGSELSDMDIQENSCRLHGLSDCSMCYDGTYSLDLSKSVNRATVSNFLARTRKPNGKEEIHARANRKREFARRIRKARIIDDVVLLSSEDEETIEEPAAAPAVAAGANQVMEEQTNELRPSEPVPSAGIQTAAHLLDEKPVDPGQIPPLTVPESAQLLLEPVQSMTTAPVTSALRTPDEVLEDLLLREILNGYGTSTAQVKQRPPNSADLPTERVSRTLSTAKASSPNLKCPKASLLRLEPRNCDLLSSTSNVTSHQADMGPITSVPWLSKLTSPPNPSGSTSSTENTSTYDNKLISLAEPRNRFVLSKSLMKTARNPGRSMSPSLVAWQRARVGKAHESAGTVRTSVIRTNPLASTSIIRQLRFTTTPIEQQLRAESTEMETSKPICYQMNTEGSWLPRACEHNCCGKGVICETVKCVTKDCPGLNAKRSIGEAPEQSNREKKQTTRQETQKHLMEKRRIWSQPSSGTSSALRKSHHHNKQQLSRPGFSQSQSVSSQSVSKFPTHDSKGQSPRSVKCRTRIVSGGPSLGNQAVLPNAGSNHSNSTQPARTQRPKGEESSLKVLSSDSSSCAAPTRSVQSSLGGECSLSNMTDSQNSEACEQERLSARLTEPNQQNQSLPSAVNEGVSSGRSSVGVPSTSGAQHTSGRSVRKLALQRTNPRPKSPLPRTSLTETDVESSRKPLVRPSSPGPERDQLCNRKRQKLGAVDTNCSQSLSPDKYQPSTMIPGISWSANDVMSSTAGATHPLPSNLNCQKLPGHETNPILSPFNILTSNPSLLPWSVNVADESSNNPQVGPSSLGAEHRLPDSVKLADVGTQELNRLQTISPEIFQKTSSACGENAMSNYLGSELSYTGPPDSRSVQLQMPQQNQPLPPFESISSKSLTSGIKEYWSHSEPCGPFQDEGSTSSESLNLGAVYASLESPAEPPVLGERVAATTPDCIVPGRNDDNCSSSTPVSIRTAVPSLPSRRNRRKPAVPKKVTIKPKQSAIKERLIPPIPSQNRRSEDFIVVCDGEAFKIKSTTVEQASPVIKDFADKCCTWLDIEGEEYRVFEVLGVPSWAMSEILKFVCRTEYNHRVMGTTHMKRLLEKLKIKYRQTSHSFIILDN